MIKTVVDAATLEYLVQQLQVPSDREIDSSMKTEILKWHAPPTSAEVKAVLDQCVHGGLCSGFVIRLLEIIRNTCEALESGTLECKLDAQLVPQQADDNQPQPTLSKYVEITTRIPSHNT